MDFLKVEGLFCQCSENKGADQLQGYRAFVFAYAKIRFSHDAAQLIYCTNKGANNKGADHYWDVPLLLNISTGFHMMRLTL